MGSKERREREREDVRTRILNAARALFVNRGYQATTMRAIASEIEFTPTTIYHHFANKEALLHEICATDTASLAGEFQRIGRIEDPLERIDRIGESYIEFALTKPMHYRLMFMTERPSHGPDSEDARNDPAESAYAFLRDSCAEAIRAGLVKPEYSDAEQLAQMLWSPLHGIVSLHLVKSKDGWVDFRDVRETAAQLRKVMLEGVRAQ